MKENPTVLNEITNEGERVTHLYPNTCYKAHLSIYQFALSFCGGKSVLDAGSGCGYGANYLAEKGTDSVIGIDFSQTAVAFSKQYFRRENLCYQEMDLQNIEGFPPETFDFIFTSNVLEHISDVPAFLHTAHKLLKPSGVMLVAVPPITNAESRQANIDNPYHLNIWSPRQWHYVLSQYFEEIECFRHHIELPNYELDFSDTPETSIPGIEDFQFLPISIELLNQIGALTAIFVVKQKKEEKNLPLVNSFPLMIDDSFTRVPQKINSNLITFIRRLGKAYRLLRTNQWVVFREEVANFIIWNLKNNI